MMALFWSFVQIGLFSIGGGYAALPLIAAQTVEQHGWLTQSQLTDMITISQMTPGPIALNVATLVGMERYGFAGAVLATVGCVTPSCIIVLGLAWLYNKYQRLEWLQGILQGIRPAVVALIAAAGWSIVQTALFGETQQFDWIAGGLFVSIFIVLRKWKLDPILIMLCAGLFGIIVYQ